jgi:hypothetical protein
MVTTPVATTDVTVTEASLASRTCATDADAVLFENCGRVTVSLVDTSVTLVIPTTYPFFVSKKA